jgi:hypothetical protein
MKLINSSLNPHIFNDTLIGINAKNTSNHRMNLMANLNRLMSLAWEATSWVGKRLVQNWRTERQHCAFLFS